MRYKNGTLIEWCSGGSCYYGVVIGTCSYDNCGEDNAYVARYVWKINGDSPRHPFGIVSMDAVELVKDWPENFYIADGWSRTPDDRCKSWVLQESEDGTLMIVPAPVQEENDEEE